jgi:hypothetical protein
VALVLLGLLLHKPTRYEPLEITAAEKKKFSRYLTNVLLPEIYNGIQRGEPFDVNVPQGGINDIVARSNWPRESADAQFSAPAALLVPDGIVLMGTATLRGVEFVVTVVLEPHLGQDGLLSLRASKLKVGAMNVTFLARIMAKRMYRHRVATVHIDKEDWRTKIAASLLNNEPFEPIFEVEGGRVRIEKIAIDEEKLTLGLVPLSD